MDDQSFDTSPRFEMGWQTWLGWGLGIISLVLLAVFVWSRLAPTPTFATENESGVYNLNGVTLTDLEIRVCILDWANQPVPVPPPSPQSCANIKDNIVTWYVDYVADPDVGFTDIDRIP